MSDEFVLMYALEGELYPVALTQGQHDAFQLLCRAIPGTVHVIKDKPQGKVVNFVGEVKHNGEIK